MKTPALLLGTALLATTACDPAEAESTTMSFEDTGIDIPQDETGDSTGGEDEDEESESGSSGDPAPVEPPPVDPPAPSCGSEALELEQRSPEIMLVLDKSRSMVTNVWDHDRESGTEDITRWASLHSVVEELVTTFDDRLDMGTVLFPAADIADVSGSQACRMAGAPDAPIQAHGGAALLDALPEATSTQIFGGTPATAGVRLATAALLDSDSDARKAIILVTDGAANCASDATPAERFSRYDEELAAVAADAFANGIPVYVVGIDIEDETLTIPVANPWEKLSEVADAGGVPRSEAVPFYDVFDEAEFQAAIDSIALDLSCSLTLDGHSGDDVTLLLDRDPVPLRDTCEGSDAGWIVDETGGARLCPSSCDVARAGAILEAETACIPEG